MVGAPVKEIRALRRGVEVLETLCRRGACSLADLNRATGLSKSTLRRILLTLEQSNFVRASLADGKFRANVFVPTQPPATFHPLVARLTTAARPVLEAMAQKVVWPSDLAVRDGLAMRIVESTRALSPLMVNRTEIGDRVEIAMTGVGRAYLAHCPAAERGDIIAALKQARGARFVSGLDKVLEETRARGYGERGRNHTGATERMPEHSDRLAACAMPVMLGARVAGCVNLLWPRDVSDRVGGAEGMAALLRPYVREIEKNLARRKDERTDKNERANRQERAADV